MKRITIAILIIILVAAAISVWLLTQGQETTPTSGQSLSKEEEDKALEEFGNTLISENSEVEIGEII